MESLTVSDLFLLARCPFPPVFGLSDAGMIKGWNLLVSAPVLRERASHKQGCDMFNRLQFIFQGILSLKCRAEMFCDCASEAGAHPHNEDCVLFNQASLEVGPPSAAR